MSKTGFRWCPGKDLSGSGCGKKVFCVPSKKFGERKFRCQQCDTRFTMDELQVLN